MLIRRNMVKKDSGSQIGIFPFPEVGAEAFVSLQIGGHQCRAARESVRLAEQADTSYRFH